jgi:hypothetical protein
MGEHATANKPRSTSAYGSHNQRRTLHNNNAQNMTIISLSNGSKGYVGKDRKFRVVNQPQGFTNIGSLTQTRPMSRDHRVRTANQMDRQHIAKQPSGFTVMSSANTTINVVQPKQVNNFFNFTNPATAGRNSAIQNQLAS